MNLERFSHTSSAYQRPTTAHRCGRAALWGKPCARGPNPDGTCGGTVECTPFLNDDRWECRRLAAAGGPCEDGPLPNGDCCRSRLPCQPRLTLRALRGRITVLALLLPLVLVAATFTLDADSAAPLNSLSHGPLSGPHARFTDQQGCVACHRAHGAKAADWIAAAFKPADMTGQCIACHTLGGPERAPHNFPAGLSEASAAATHGGPAETSCTMCHTEHRGIAARISTVSDAQCQTCHTDKFTAFRSGHPAFGPHYPYAVRTAINFDHLSHLAKHFPAAPKASVPEGCVTCHQIDKATRAVPVGDFETTCATCHRTQIVNRDLVAFVLPELSPAQFMAIDHEAAASACGPLDSEAAGTLADALKTAEAAVKANDPQGDFVAVSDQQLAPVERLLTGVEGDGIVDLDPQQPAVATLLGLLPQMAKDGSAPLAQLIDQRFGAGQSAKLLAGLAPEIVRRAACAWSANAEYAGKPPPGGGWYVDGVALKYKPSGHADTVVKAWVEAALMPGPAATGQADAAPLADFRSTLFDRQNGPGTCLGCHALTDTAATGSEAESINSASSLRIEWRNGVTEGGRYVRYSHRPHINLLGPGTDCQNCHLTNAEAAYGDAFNQVNPHHYESNFQGIRMEQCTSCHGAGEVRDDCTTCHNYHRQPGFRKLMMKQAKQE
jgi:predicted CXXCH cytochrome family protein